MVVSTLALRRLMRLSSLACSFSLQSSTVLRNTMPYPLDDQHIAQELHAVQPQSPHGLLLAAERHKAVALCLA